ncbi:MAG TPA: ECF-type sigma factor [Tahibacter sp.]|nr:ECF-type sigma factor [Tahibacter sp.]
MHADDDSVTRWLQRWRDGDALALERLLPFVYADLRRIAASTLRGHQGHATLQPTALVHEVLLRLLGGNAAAFNDTTHLLNGAARMMRQVLVDRARAAATAKRGGDWVRDDYAGVLELPLPDGVDVVALDAALDELEQADARMAQVVQLRYFIGLEMNEVAAALGVSERTAQRDWVAAREWLRERL